MDKLFIVCYIFLLYISEDEPHFQQHMIQRRSLDWILAIIVEWNITD